MQASGRCVCVRVWYTHIIHSSTYMYVCMYVCMHTTFFVRTLFSLPHHAHQNSMQSSPLNKLLPNFSKPIDISSVSASIATEYTTALCSLGSPRSGLTNNPSVKRNVQRCHGHTTHSPCFSTSSISPKCKGPFRWGHSVPTA